MKRFLIFGLLLLFISILFTVFVWYLVQESLKRNSSNAEELNSSSTVPEVTATTSTTTEVKPTEPHAEEATATTSEMLDEKPIPLSTLPLSDAQISILKAAGIDVETFVITPTMIACAKAKLSSQRFDAILGGDAPTFSETISLMGCIR